MLSDFTKQKKISRIVVTYYSALVMMEEFFYSISKIFFAMYQLYSKNEKASAIANICTSVTFF